MKSFLIATVCLSFSALGNAPARADATPFNITFTTIGNGNPTIPSGSFSYDSGTNTFFSFIVSDDGYTFDLTGAANSYGVTPANNCGTGQSFFTYLTTDGGCALWSLLLSGGFGGPGSGGSQFSFGAPNFPSTGYQGILGASGPYNGFGLQIYEGNFSVAPALVPTPEPSYLGLLTLCGLAGLGVGVYRKDRAWGRL